jgi:hypothetical protein
MAKVGFHRTCHRIFESRDQSIHSWQNGANGDLAETRQSQGEARRPSWPTWASGAGPLAALALL